MRLEYGKPFTGKALEALTHFLGTCGLAYDRGVQFSVCLYDDEAPDGGALAAGSGGAAKVGAAGMVATGSLDGRVLKCIGVDGAFTGEGLAATVVSELVQEAGRRGQSHLFIFTKPENRELFASLGFYPIAATDRALVMENRRHGIERFVAGLAKNAGAAVAGAAQTGAPRESALGASGAGAVVVHCNPFTKGHRYLLEEAARNCGVLHVFVLSEGTHDQGDFPPEVRRTLVEQGIAHLPNVIVHPTGPYLISAATFPDYFLRKTSESADRGAAASAGGGTASVAEDAAAYAGSDAVALAVAGPPASGSLATPAQDAAAINAELDLVIFAEHFAQPLGIRRRFVGTEPFSPVTAAYNRQMQAVLPRYGIEVEVIPRKEHAGRAISATEVRRLIAQGRLEELRPLVPEVTWQYLRGVFAAGGS